MTIERTTQPDANPAVHRTEPEQAADEGYPIDEIEQGTEWVPHKDRPSDAKEKGEAPAVEELDEPKPTT